MAWRQELPHGSSNGEESGEGDGSGFSKSGFDLKKGIRIVHLQSDFVESVFVGDHGSPGHTVPVCGLDVGFLLVDHQSHPHAADLYLSFFRGI